MAATYSYPKTEKLKSRKMLSSLFTTGKTFTVFPVKVFYLPAVMADTCMQAGVGVSARHFKKAVDRNRIKRLLRECYRLNKTSLHEVLNKKQEQLAVFFLYVGKELPDHALLNEKMQQAITKLEENCVR